MKIGIFGHYGNRNLGDEATIEAVIASVRRHFPDPEINCFSVNPADTAVRHGVEAFPISWSATPRAETRPEPDGMTGRSAGNAGAGRRSRAVNLLKRSTVIRRLVRGARSVVSGIAGLRYEVPFLVENYRRLRTCDLLMITGSNQFLDNFGGVWGFPFTLLKWVVLARVAGTKVALVSLGAGPLRSRLSRQFARWTVGLADYVSYRDPPSRLLVEGQRPAFKGLVYPDLANNLELAEESPARAARTRPLVGLNAMPVFDDRYWSDPDSMAYAAYVEKLAVAVGALVASGKDCMLFNTQQQDKLVATDVIQLVRDRYGETVASHVTRRDSDTTSQLVDAMQSADLCVATRFHGVVLSVRCGVPVIGICYHRKIGDFLEDSGLGSYQLDIAGFSAEDLVELIDRMVTDIESARRNVERARRRNRELVEDQYRQLSGLFGRQR